MGVTKRSERGQPPYFTGFQESLDSSIPITRCFLCLEITGFQGIFYLFRTGFVRVRNYPNTFCIWSSVSLIPEYLYLLLNLYMVYKLLPTSIILYSASLFLLPNSYFFIVTEQKWLCVSHKTSLLFTTIIFKSYIWLHQIIWFAKYNRQRMIFPCGFLDVLDVV